MYTEMVSAKAILYKNKNTRELLQVREEEHPVAVQLFGSDPAIMAEIAAQVAEGPYEIIDVNMGCPVPKIVNNGEGSSLMRNPKLAEEILTAMVKAVKKPVTVKFRKGFYNGETTAVEFAKMAEASGVAAVAVHGRTREQYYSGKADWDIIRQVKEMCIRDSRKSCIQREGYVVLSAKLLLKKGEKAEIQAQMEDFAARRREKQPLEYPSGGSTFKRPEGYFAGKLIEDAGLKGFTVGGAQVSEKHSGFVINRNNATSSEVYELCQQVQARVMEKFGVSLEMEVKRLGDFSE